MSVRAFSSPHLLLLPLKKYSGSCVCSHLAQNSVYTVDIGTTRAKHPSHAGSDDISALNEVSLFLMNIFFSHRCALASFLGAGVIVSRDSFR